MSELKPEKMIHYQNRINTFDHWIYNNQNVKCTAEKMAQSGFYLLSNERDATKCFVCMKTLNDWEAEDDPFEEHKKHAPYCPFINVGKAEEDLTLFEHIELLQNMHINLRKMKLQEQKKILRDKLEIMISELKKNERKKKI